MRKPSYNKNYFERITCQRGYSKNPLVNLTRKLVYEVQPVFRALMIKIFFRSKNLLEVGCGTGRFVYWARKLEIVAYGVDISSYALSKANPEIRRYFKEADVSQRIPFNDNSFELVTSFSFLEHIPEGKLLAVLQECQRVSKKFTLHKIFTKTLFQPSVDDPTHITVKPKIWWHEFFKRLKIKEGSKFFLKWEPGLFLLEK